MTRSIPWPGNRWLATLLVVAVVGCSASDETSRSPAFGDAGCGPDCHPGDPDAGVAGSLTPDGPVPQIPPPVDESGEACFQ